MRNNLHLPICLLLAATGCANLKPEAASRNSEALEAHGIEMSDRSTAWLNLLGETAHCVGEFFDDGSLDQR